VCVCVCVRVCVLLEIQHWYHEIDGLGNK
jgi:hypothetical protein